MDACVVDQDVDPGAGSAVKARIDDWSPRSTTWPYAIADVSAPRRRGHEMSVDALGHQRSAIVRAVRADSHTGD
jgi:hypothetical protein